MPDRRQARAFQRRVLNWYRLHGRKDLPWQRERSPYGVWISEIMLQQTQVETVIPYFERFVARFPDLPTLAEASLDQVLEHWAGLGYYARARHLHRAARALLAEFGGEIPGELEALTMLPGIGRSTAGAIVSLGHGRSAPILDGNVKRVLCRYRGIHGWPGATAIMRELWALSECFTPEHHAPEYNQAMMDIGATVCTPRTPRCSLCPVEAGCMAHRSGRTGEIPSPKPRRDLPTRQMLIAVITDPNGRIYLEQRPPSGIWGSLWCLPLFEARNELDEWSRRRGIVLRSVEPLSRRRHTFSHFHLDYLPLLAIAASPRLRIRESFGERWQPRGRCELGLPAPVRTLLDELGHFEQPAE